MKLIPDHILTSLISASFLNLDYFFNLSDELLLSFGKLLPRHSRLLLLYSAIFKIDQHLNPIIIGLLEESVSRPYQKTAVITLLEAREKMEVLNMEGHGHEVIRAEGSKWKRVFS